MARKAKSGEVNKSQAVRDLLNQNPNLKAKEVVAALAEKGIKINSPLYYFVKGKMQGLRSTDRPYSSRPVDFVKGHSL